MCVQTTAATNHENVSTDESEYWWMERESGEYSSVRCVGEHGKTGWTATIVVFGVNMQYILYTHLYICDIFADIMNIIETHYL